jgi:phage shock protein A
MLAAEKRERMRVTSLEKSAKEWEERATRAVQAGDDALAKEALARKLEVEAELAEAVRAADEQRHHVDELTAALKALDQRVKEVKARKETLKVQARAKKSRDKGGSSTDAFSRFDELSTDVDVKEAELALDEELKSATHEDARSLDVERKLADLEKGSEIDDRLAALKKKIEKKD